MCHSIEMHGVDVSPFSFLHYSFILFVTLHSIQVFQNLSYQRTYAINELDSVVSVLAFKPELIEAVTCLRLQFIKQFGIDSSKVRNLNTHCSFLVSRSATLEILIVLCWSYWQIFIMVQNLGIIINRQF